MALTTYCQDEIVSVSQLSRNLKKVMDALENKKKYKIGIVKNNQIKAAIISADFLKELEELLQHYQKNKKQNRILFEQIESKYC